MGFYLGCSQKQSVWEVSHGKTGRWEKTGKRRNPKGSCIKRITTVDARSRSLQGILRNNVEPEPWSRERPAGILRTEKQPVALGVWPAEGPGAGAVGGNWQPPLGEALQVGLRGTSWPHTGLGPLSLQFSEGTVLSLPTSLVYTALCLKFPAPPPPHSANLSSFSTFRVTASWRPSLTTVPTFCPTPIRQEALRPSLARVTCGPRAQPHWVPSSC